MKQVISEQRERDHFSFYVFLVTNTSNCVKMWYLSLTILSQAAFPTNNVVLCQILFSHYFINKEQHEESTEERKKDLGKNLSKVSFQQWNQLSQRDQLSWSCSLTQLCFKLTTVFRWYRRVCSEEQDRNCHSESFLAAKKTPKPPPQQQKPTHFRKSLCR